MDDQWEVLNISGLSIAYFAHPAFVDFDPGTTVMAMLTGYFDAAGDNHAEHALTVGGYLAPVRSWSRFRRDWQQALGRHGIAVFHMTDFIAGQPPFERWRNRPQEQMTVLEQLSNVIVRHAHFSPATTVLLDDWRAVNKEYRLKECRATPYCVAAFKVIDKSIQWLKREHAHDVLKEFVFEAGDNGFGDLLAWMNWVREVAPRGSLDAIYPIPKPKALAPLQAADFAGWEQRFAAVRRVQGWGWDLRPSMASLLKVKHQWGVTKKENILELCDRFKIPKRDAHRPSQRETAEWRPEPFARLKTARGKARSSQTTERGGGSKAFHSGQRTRGVQSARVLVRRVPRPFTQPRLVVVEVFKGKDLITEAAWIFRQGAGVADTPIPRRSIPGLT